MLKHIRGFSLIELMIVLSIISILSLMAIPSYQRYTQRARFAEVLSTAHIFQTAVAIAIQEGAALTDIHDGNAGIPPQPKPSKNLAALKVEQGIITATATQAAGSATYILKPSSDGSSWAVGGTCLHLGFCNS